MDDAARRKHALNFLNSGKQGRSPRSEEFAAYGQACVAMAEGVIRLLQSHESRLFASIIPRHAKPGNAPTDVLRKDMVFLLERFYYFLEAQRQMGLIVMDGTEKKADRLLTRRMERYFTLTLAGRQRTQWIVPVPLFVESDMAYGVQVADLCIYCLNWGWRLPGRMTEPTRPEIEPFGWLLHQMQWRGDGYRNGGLFQADGYCYISDPYDA